MILVPSTLATLPRAAIAPGKKALASPVHSLAVERGTGHGAGAPALRRKQRPEVVLALPGGAVQVYDVRAAKLIASYAAPPDTKFVCQPASVVLHPPLNAPTLGRRRVTVAAIQPIEAAAGVKLVLWEERLGRNVPLPDRMISHQKDVQAGTLVRIDVSIVVSGAEEKLCIVGVEENGAMRCWSEELDSLSSLPQTEPSVKTEAVFFLDLENARKGLLQGRDDIVITAASAGMQDVVVSVLVAEGAEDESRARRTVLKIHSIHPSAPGSLRAAARVDELATIALPDSSYAGKHAPKFFTHSGRLLQQSKKHLTVYRLTGSSPKVEHEIGFNDQVSSMIPLSSRTIAAVSPSAIEILDIKHRALLGSRKFNEASEELGEPKVNGTNGSHSEKTRIQLVSFNASNGSLVGIRDHTELVSFTVGGDEQDPRPKKKLRQSSLADAVGRGMHLNSNMRYSELSIKLPHKFGTLEARQPLPNKWSETISQLDLVVGNGDSQGFDALARPHIPDHSRSGQPNQEVLDAVLTRIFAIDSGSRSDKGQLRVVTKLWPNDTVALLVGRGCLAQSRLELAHRRQGSLSAVQSLEPHTIIKSVGVYDRSLRTLDQLLNFDVYFSTRELVCAVGAGLRRIHQIQSLSAMRLLTDGEVSMEDGKDTEADQEAEEDAENMESYARQLIETALARLHGARPQQLHAALAAELQHLELLVLVDHLRVSIADSGWLSHYGDAAPDPAPLTPDAARGGLPFVLLNEALDVLGSSAWLRGTAARAPDAATTLSHMRTEITAALECVEESAYLSGLLHEVLVYARTVPRGAAARLEAPPPQQQEDEELGGAKAAKKGPVRPLLVASADDDGLDAAGVLPLGLKHQAPQQLEAEMMVKVKAGGRMERRSTREVGHLKSMRVGKHTLERITF